jgi:hypothetical protein
LDQVFTRIKWNRFNKIEKQKTKIFEKDDKNDLVLCWTLTWLEYAFNFQNNQEVIPMGVFDERTLF